jgi:tRNA(Arg) A34 adenosine deaminase TadA
VTRDDERFLRRAIALAVATRAEGNPPSGSLLVSGDGTVLAEDRNTTLTDNDISAHPELKLARWAAREPESSGVVT